MTRRQSSQRTPRVAAEAAALGSEKVAFGGHLEVEVKCTQSEIISFPSLISPRLIDYSLLGPSLPPVERWSRS